jgi:hypothetical protein
VSASTRDEAQRRREEARRRRRESADEQDDGVGDEQEREPATADATDHGTLAGAAKVLVAGAAVGAAAGAARALASRDDQGERENGEEQSTEDTPRSEPHDPVDEAGDDEREQDASPDTAAAEDEQPARAERPRRQEPRAQEPRAPDDGRAELEGGTPEETSDVVGRAREQLRALRGEEPESLSSLERAPSGWVVTFEVVELARVPDSTDVMASYEVVLDDRKNVVRYARLRRYYRSQAEREDGS